MDRTGSTIGWCLPPALIAAAFAVALCPLLADHLLFHPDERHYVDAALGMLSSADWLTPRTAEGELRLQKPILAYWFAAAGADLWGPSPFSVRALFLCAGAAMIWFAARAAKVISGSATAATLTACLLACHPAVMLSSTRSLPDVLLGLFLTISLTGFLTILTQRRADWLPLALAYVGGALAVLAKGSPAVVFLLYASAYVAWTERTLMRAHWGRFLLAASLAALLGSSWFLVMHQLHGGELTRQFLVDQGAAHRFAANPAQVLGQSVGSVLLLTLSFAPFSVPAIRPLWNRRRDVAAASQRGPHHFLWGWIGLFVFSTACINHVNLRYLIPAAVALAIQLGCLIAELDGPLLRRNLRLSAYSMLGLLLLTGVIASWLSLDSVIMFPLLGTATMLLLVRLWKQLRYTSVMRSVTVSTAAALAMVLIVSATFSLRAAPSFGVQVASLLRQHGDVVQPLELTLIGHAAHASKVRICSRGDVQVIHVPPHKVALARPAGGVIATLDPAWISSASREARTVQVPCGYEDLDPLEAWRAWRRGELPNYLAEHTRTYSLLIPNGDLNDAGLAPTMTAESDSDSIIR